VEKNSVQTIHHRTLPELRVLGGLSMRWATFIRFIPNRYSEG
jgi:hypothetical protein